MSKQRRKEHRHGSIVRDPSTLGLEARIDVGGRSRPPVRTALPRTRDDLLADIAAWRELGVTHLHVDTRRTGFTDVEQHLEQLVRVKKLIDAELALPAVRKRRTDQLHQPPLPGRPRT